MRTALHLLLAICVLWCATGLAEPVDAGTPFDWGHVAASDAAAPQAPVGDTPDASGQGHHHHCPVAPDLAPDRMAAPIARSAIAPALPGVVPLASLAHAPPLQPPAA